MAIAKEIRLKIHSIKNTQKITKAMEMVAASKMRKTQDRMQRAIPYAKKILNVISHVAQANSEYRHPFMEHRDIKRAGYIIITTDRGLCGGLNNNLLKATLRAIKENIDNGIEAELCLIGNKAMAFFKRIGGNVVAHKGNLGDTPSLADLIGIIKVMLDAYLEQRIDALYLCSNEFVTTMRQEPRIQQVLPLIPAEDTELQHHWDYIYEPDSAPELLEKLLTRYIESQVYRAVIENIASEQAARMLAMRNATDNAGELISSLQLAYNKARQAAITRELSEIVAGASVI
ncbi:F0F1 ATP synthase subunit gamma [Aquicella lusitana]|uniref:ATP synthase gamma chain n=1 Tax=Aquicella lusitana TaxID=254246 RepID=A0A370GXE9_9COXI|nr:F0F1 ATP synthase subunit gamma [Aquicella lusitana]RDI46563.1 ATP synthase F1 subcomplex gamma subunit [Aquicella lusitana]VVC74227.1 ATP synthase gamma chain [Aquicella lusitana]